MEVVQHHSQSAGVGSKMCGGGMAPFAETPTFPLLGPSWFLAGMTTFYHRGEENVSTWETLAGLNIYARPR